MYDLAYCCRYLSRPTQEWWIENDSLGAKAPVARRWLLGRTSHIVCHTDRQGRGTRTRHVLDRGEIVFAGVGVSEPGVRLPPP